MAALTAAEASPYSGPERRVDAGYQRRLLEETHSAAMDTRERLFEGNNGVPPIVVQISNLQTCQERQEKDIGDMEKKRQEEMKEIRTQLGENTIALLAMQGTMKIMVGGWKIVLVGLLIPLLIYFMQFVAALITGQQIIVTPTPMP